MLLWKSFRKAKSNVLDIHYRSSAVRFGIFRGVSSSTAIACYCYLKLSGFEELHPTASQSGTEPLHSFHRCNVKGWMEGEPLLAMLLTKCHCCFIGVLALILNAVALDEELAKIYVIDK